MWTPTCIMSQCDKVGMRELVPVLAESSTAPLKTLLPLLSAACQHNFISALLVVGGAVMNFHYTQVNIIAAVITISYHYTHRLPHCLGGFQLS